MSKKSKQTTSVIGVMMFSVGGFTDKNTEIGCSVCGDAVSNIEYQGDKTSGKLKLGGICMECSERTDLLRNNGFDSELFQMMLSDY